VVCIITTAAAAWAAATTSWAAFPDESPLVILFIRFLCSLRSLFSRAEFGLAPGEGRRVRRYQYTAIDDATRIRALQIYERHSQANAIRFFDYVLKRSSYEALRDLLGHLESVSVG
jgi:hypothetical protein